MEHFEGDELITINFSKYQYLLECRARVKKFDFFIELLEIDDDKLAKSLSKFASPTAFRTLEDSGIITVRDLKHYLITKYPADTGVLQVRLPGLYPSTTISILQRILSRPIV